MQWTVELTVGDFHQNGFVDLARWLFFDEASARDFITLVNAMIPDGAEPDPDDERVGFAFILDLHEGDDLHPWGNMVDNSRLLPTQTALSLAPEQVRRWLAERPDPDSVNRRGELLPVPMGMEEAG